MFSFSGMEKPMVVISGIPFRILCLILDFAYLGQAQVPHDLLDEFIKAGETLQIRGIKEGRIHFMQNQVQTVQQTRSVNRSFDATISSTQQEAGVEPSAKRPRDEEDISIQEASEIMKMLLDSSADIDPEAAGQVKPTAAISQAMPVNSNISMTVAKAPNQQQAQRSFILAPHPTPALQGPIRPAIMGKDKPKFECRFCFRYLSSQGRNKKHENECSMNPDRLVAVCDICKQEMKPSSLTQHKNSKHSQKKPNQLPESDKLKAMSLLKMTPPQMTNPVDTTIDSLDESNNSGKTPSTYDPLSDCDVSPKAIKQELNEGASSPTLNVST